MESEWRDTWRLCGGKTPEQWNFTTVESLLEDSKNALAVGVMYPGKNTVDGVPLVKISDVKNGRVTGTPDFLISAQKDEEYKRTRLFGNELLITLVGNPGDCVFVTEEMANWNIARAIAVLRLKNKQLRKWVRLALLSHPTQQFMSSRFNTTVQRTLNLKDIREIVLPIPPTKVRQGITELISALDDKIDLNRRMNETLESMAQALFKSWFVDFDPVIDNALAAGNPIPDPLRARAETRRALGDQRKPLPDEIQKLFPDAFVFDDEMGWIPEGWEVSMVGKEFRVTMGQSPPGHTYNQEGNGTPFFQGSTDFGFRFPTNRVYCTAPKRMAKLNDTLVSVRAPVGDVNMAMEDCCVGRGVTAVRHSSASRSFTYYGMIQLRERFKVYEAEGTVFGSINQKDFNELVVLKYPTALVAEFEQLASDVDEKIERNSQSISSLTKLRDTLLPKLLSGELRIPDAEKLVADSL